MKLTFTSSIIYHNIFPNNWNKLKQATSFFIKKFTIMLSLLILNNSCCNLKDKYQDPTHIINQEFTKELTPTKKLRIHKIPYSIHNLLLPKIHDIELDNYDPLTQLHLRFNIIADQVEAKDFLLELVNNTSINMVIHPQVQGTISLSLKNVTIKQVLAEIQKIYGYGFEYSTESIRIFPVALQTKVFKVNYLDLIRSGSSGTNINFSSISSGNGSNNANVQANNNSNSNNNGSKSSNANGSSISTTHSTNVWEQLKLTIEIMLGIDSTNNNKKPDDKNEKNVAISPTTGMIIVTAYPNELEKIEQFLHNAENTLNRQVMLEAKVLEVDLKEGYRSGINWALLNQHMNLRQTANAGSTGEIDYGADDTLQSSSVNPVASTDQIDLATASRNKFSPNLPSTQQLTPFGGLFTLGVNYRKLAAFVELLSAQGNVQVLSSPRITTSNNQKALIKVGKDQYYVTGVSNGQNNNTNNNQNNQNNNNTTTTAPTVTLTPFFSGIALDVTPQIGEDEITLHIHPIISNVDGSDTSLPGYEGNIQLASSSIRESDSIVRAKNGQLIIIGGLMKDKTAEVETGVPFFQDLPLFGKLFKHTRQQAAKSELVILLRPIILDDFKVKEQIKQSYQRINNIDPNNQIESEYAWLENP